MEMIDIAEWQAEALPTDTLDLPNKPRCLVCPD